jgi:peptidoglycan/xylan/chitin deacetylase (PgdA/CDA1 family)
MNQDKTMYHLRINKILLSLLKSMIVILLGIGFSGIQAQTNPYTNNKIIKYLHKDNLYNARKDSVTKKLAHSQAGRWGEFVKGVNEDMVTTEKVVAFTFDACGGGHKGNGYDSSLINYLRKEKVAATLFVTGLWIDANYKTFLALAKDTLFEIENHGLYHKPCSINGDSAYGIHGTKDIAAAYDEIAANAEKIKLITGRRPGFFRSATAFTDEACVRMAKMIGVSIVSYDILSGDGVPEIAATTIVNNVLKHVKPGAIIIMHFNRPDNNTFKALKLIIPKLRLEGYSFAKLQNYPLKGKR